MEINVRQIQSVVKCLAKADLEINNFLSWGTEFGV
jgi:hypothetical protein